MSHRTHRKSDNWRVSGADRPEWTFFAESDAAAEVTAKTFTRWDLEGHGKTGEFTIVLANVKTGAARELRVTAGNKAARPQPDSNLAEAA